MLIQPPCVLTTTRQRGCNRNPLPAWFDRLLRVAFLGILVRWRMSIAAPIGCLAMYVDVGKRFSQDCVTVTIWRTNLPRITHSLVVQSDSAHHTSEYVQAGPAAYTLDQTLIGYPFFSLLLAVRIEARTCFLSAG